MNSLKNKVSKAPVRKHSRTGCITCKVRKKRCSEDKPVCSDCKRLGFTCVYLRKSADKDVLQQCKEQVEKELFLQKNRKKFIAGFEELGVNSGRHILDDKGGDEEVQLHKEWEDEEEDEDEEEALSDEFETEPSVSWDLDWQLKQLSEAPFMPLEEESISVSQSPYLSQPLSDPITLQLDPVGIHLYNYYRDHLAKIISIAPVKQNYYLQVFLPMAHKHRGILYGLMAWSAHHLSISQEGSETRDRNYYALANRYTLESLRCLRSEMEHNFLWSLAQLLILCGAEICQGDVAKWKVLLKYGADLIEKNVGKDISHLLTSYKTTTNLDTTATYWLVANFIYHDVMCSRGTHFPIEQYNKVLSTYPTNPGISPAVGVNRHVDPLHGINRPILLITGDITNLTRKMKSAAPFDKNHPRFREYMSKAYELQTQLYQIVPDGQELEVYEESSAMYTLCLELFQLMKLASLMHLKTTCLGHSKHSIEIQHLWLELFSKLDLILGSKLEGCLCFPMFICGINATDREQKRDIEVRFSDIAKRYKCYNFQRARTIMRKVWQQDDGDIEITSNGSMSDVGSIELGDMDWYDIVDAMGWDISFA
ncbi:UGA3 (YDL170W) [Zygosaccharomyces parabailii]|nr:UGA3 (YDL170W) [Zygosaccharomyces parabailii]CDH11318.1 related to Transcriptional activator protein UGA3 [Zygosaccharomyces bailii ISA1307]